MQKQNKTNITNNYKKFHKFVKRENGNIVSSG